MTLSLHDANTLLSQFATAKESGDYAQFEQFLIDQMTYADTNVVCDIVWQADDIRSVREDWPDEKIQEAGSFVSKRLANRSIEEGWQILEDLLVLFEDEIKEKDKTS